MSESGLSIGLPELRQEVGFYLSYGRSGWSAEQTAEIDSIIQSGIRRVYYPPALAENIAGHEWSWLRPTAALAIVAGEYDYDLPDDLSRVVGGFHFPVTEYRGEVVRVSLGRILEERAREGLAGAPRLYAERYKASNGSAGQRLEVLFYPKPDSAWTLTYEYEAYQGALDAMHPYPLGGMKLAELYIESCLAVAETRLNGDTSGLHRQQYEALLVDAISRDRKSGTLYYGQMGHSERDSSDFRRGYTGSVYPITYNGEVI